MPQENPNSVFNRSSSLGVVPDLSKKFTKEESLEVFRKMCVARDFEFWVKKAYDEKHIKMPIYLSVGHESIAAALSVAFPKPYIFAQHRAHDTYLSYGANPAALIDELLHKPTGCAKGMGGSASIHAPEIGMFGHSGLLGDQVPIAVGFAMGKNERTLCIMGDAAAEEDYALGALGYASHKKAPVLFVVIDNDLSVLTRKEVRRNWNIADVAAGFGLPTVDITDDPWLVMHHVREMQNKLPALINVHTVRHLWHAGTGVDGEPEWNRFQMVRAELIELGYGAEVQKIEQEAQATVDAWWTVAWPKTA
jgi:acetoin:2,6-dichlorophenolindophenol oxidoreductase subunit alpha